MEKNQIYKNIFAIRAFEFIEEITTIKTGLILKKLPQLIIYSTLLT